MAEIIENKKTILTNVDGWTPLIDHLVAKYGLITAAVFGKVWRYCQLPDGICRASQKRIADELGLYWNTVHDSLKLLVKDGFLKAEKRRGKPTIYRDTGKAGLNASIKATPVVDTDPSQPLALDNRTPVSNTEVPLALNNRTSVSGTDNRESLRESFKKQERDDDDDELHEQSDSPDPPVETSSSSSAHQKSKNGKPSTELITAIATACKVSKTSQKVLTAAEAIQSEDLGEPLDIEAWSREDWPQLRPGNARRKAPWPVQVVEGLRVRKADRERERLFWDTDPEYQCSECGADVDATDTHCHACGRELAPVPT